MVVENIEGHAADSENFEPGFLRHLPTEGLFGALARVPPAAWDLELALDDLPGLAMNMCSSTSRTIPRTTGTITFSPPETGTRTTSGDEPVHIS